MSIFWNRLNRSDNKLDPRRRRRCVIVGGLLLVRGLLIRLIVACKQMFFYNVCDCDERGNVRVGIELSLKFGSNREV